MQRVCQCSGRKTRTRTGTWRSLWGRTWRCASTTTTTRSSTSSTNSSSPCSRDSVTGDNLKLQLKNNVHKRNKKGNCIEAQVKKKSTNIIIVKKLLEWWVLCSANFTIKFKYKKCQSLYPSECFCKIDEINIALLFVVVWMLNFITRFLQRLRTVYLQAMDAQTCTVLGSKMFTALKQIFYNQITKNWHITHACL